MILHLHRARPDVYKTKYRRISQMHPEYNVSTFNSKQLQKSVRPLLRQSDQFVAALRLNGRRAPGLTRR